jgi:hypothetical protein
MSDWNPRNPGPRGAEAVRPVLQNPDYRQQLTEAIATALSGGWAAHLRLQPGPIVSAPDAYGALRQAEIILANPDLIVTTVPLLAAAIVSLIGDHPQGRAGALRVTRAIAAALKEANHD